MLSDFGKKFWTQLSNLNVWWPHLFIGKKRCFCKCFQTLSSSFLYFWQQLFRHFVKLYFESREKLFEEGVFFLKRRQFALQVLEQKRTDVGITFGHGCFNFIRIVHGKFYGSFCVSNEVTSPKFFRKLSL